MNELENRQGITYCRNGRAITGRLHDELVMMDPEQGKYFSLNPVATRIWDLLEVPMGLGEITAALMNEYEVGEDQCRAEVKEYLGEMTKLDLIAIVDS